RAVVVRGVGVQVAVGVKVHAAKADVGHAHAADDGEVLGFVDVKHDQVVGPGDGGEQPVGGVGGRPGKGAGDGHAADGGECEQMLDGHHGGVPFLAGRGPGTWSVAAAAGGEQGGRGEQAGAGGRGHVAELEVVVLEAECLAEVAHQLDAGDADVALPAEPGP